MLVGSFVVFTIRANIRMPDGAVISISPGVPILVHAVEADGRITGAVALGRHATPHGTAHEFIRFPLPRGLDRFIHPPIESLCGWDQCDRVHDEWRKWNI